MTAFNIVRFRVKPGHDEAFIEAHRRADRAFKGFLRGSLVKTGERSYCMVGEWDSFASLAAARPQMIGLLDTFRADLEDLGSGLGLTDPVSGEVVLTLPT
jgi:quinol monooxygenase YgiN